MYLLTALTLRGLMIAGVMGVVGFTVGQIVGRSGSTTPKVCLFTVCLLFYAGLSGGRIAPGEPYAMWAFLCASGALMVGVLFPGEEPSDAEEGEPC